MKINDFASDRDFAENKREWLDQIYRSKFGDRLLKIEEITDKEMQKKGVDIVLQLDNGKLIYIEEKIRKKRFEPEDVLLEEYQHLENKEPGWLNRNKITDYLVYAFADCKQIYFFPFLLLQQAWINNYRAWKQEYGVRTAKTRGYYEEYHATNIPVPTEDIFTALRMEMFELGH